MKIAPPSSENKNKPAKNAPLKINEIFYSLQGEGLYSGAACVFIRFAGCNLACGWCDTKYAAKTNLILTPRQILAEIKKYPARDVVLTGGEPCLQDLSALIKQLAARKYRVHLETNGTIDIDTKNIFCATVSPKGNCARPMLKKADAIKLIVDGKLSEKQILQYKKYKRAALFLQPLSNQKEKIAKCLHLIKKHPQLRLSLQLHKIIKIK